jgi:hypothetical protein
MSNTFFIEDTPAELVVPEYDLDFLHSNALWMIMDCWYPHPWPHDVEADPEIDQRTDTIVKKIVDYLPKLTHVRLSSPERFPVHPDLAHIENWYNETPGVNSAQTMYRYMVDNGLQDVVYTGFHLGRCILQKETGAINMSKAKFRLWQKDDLVGRLVTDNEQEMLARSRRYMYVI